MLKRPLRFVVRSLSQYSSVMETVEREVGFTPAQLKMWLILLYFLIMEATTALEAFVEPISKAEMKWSPSSQRDSVSEREEGLMSVRARVAPSWESLMAVARPIPEPAPVQRMILFSNCLAIVRDRVTNA